MSGKKGPIAPLSQNEKFTGNPWDHDHIFKQDQVKAGEKRTLVVIILTATTMVLEITSGLLFGSMALLADGLHMASHATALLLAWFAYRYARRHAQDRRYSFGTGKVNALAGFSGALLLALFALGMGYESIERLFRPVPIEFNYAIAVAVIGLGVNAASVFILGGHHHHHDHQEQGQGHDHPHHDHNLRSAYLHVLADALTSVFAIIALVVGKFYGQVWLDPVMGIVGGILVARWSWGLLRQTSHVLLDREGPEQVRQMIRASIEADRAHRITDLHVWSIGPQIYAAIISVLTSEGRSPDYFKSLIPADASLVHVTIEVFARQAESDQEP